MQILVQFFYIFYLLPTTGTSYCGYAVVGRVSKPIRPTRDAHQNIHTTQCVMLSPIVTMHKVVPWRSDCVGVV